MSVENERSDARLLSVWQAMTLLGDVRERSDEIESSELEAILGEAESLLVAAVSRPRPASVIPFPGTTRPNVSSSPRVRETTGPVTSGTPETDQPSQLLDLNAGGREAERGAAVTRLDADVPPASATVSEAGAHPQQRLSIVVLPFADLSRDRGQQYLADGITEDLTANLSRFTDMLVISRYTAFTYRNKPFDTRQIGRELGVRYVLEGSVRRSGRRVRVNARLIDAEADGYLWVERFDRRLSDLFELQDEFTTAIAGAIEPELLKSERNRTARRPLQGEDAYEIYQRGLWHFYRYTREDSVEAQALFRRALAMDAQYPQPVAQLAIALCNAAYLGWADDASLNYVEAYELAQRAVSIDVRYPAAHFARGLVCMWTHRSDLAMSSFPRGNQSQSQLCPRPRSARPDAPLPRPSGGGDRACRKGNSPQPKGSPPVYLATRALGRALSAEALRRGDRSRATVLDAQSKLAGRPALCRCRVGPGRPNRGGQGSA